jgi:hypothetical protein
VAEHHLFLQTHQHHTDENRAKDHQEDQPMPNGKRSHNELLKTTGSFCTMQAELMLTCQPLQAGSIGL